MTLSPARFPNLRQHWFLFLAPLIIAGDLMVGLVPRGEPPRWVEAAVLFDFAVVLPLLCWACYRSQGRRAILRALALSCLGIWAAGHVVPADEQVLLAWIAPLRYVGLAVLVWIEIAIVVAIWKAVFTGASADSAAASVSASHDMPPWVAKLMAWEARVWLKGWTAVRRLFGK